MAVFPMTHHDHALTHLLGRLNAQEYVTLAPFSTLKIGGPARYFVVVNSIGDLTELQKACIEYGMKLHVLSGGSNSLFSDEGFLGVVIKLGPAFDFITHQNNSFLVGAATSFAKITKLALNQGWEFALGWCGTPGLVGGATKMNAGGRMGEIKDAIHTVQGSSNGQYVEWQKNEIEFGYRTTSLPENLIITKVILSNDKKQTASIDELLVKVQEYRIKRKLTQPTTNSLGSFFKNPYPSFAAQLIEKCNLKGLRYKGAQISPLHANFIINNGGASADDILHIASVAQKAVFERFGIALKPEIRMVGNFKKDLLLDTNKLIMEI